MVPIFTALFVSIKAPDRIGSFFRWWIGLQLACLFFFIVFPVAPPWMVDHDVTRLAALATGNVEDNNAVSATPSLHVALPAVMAFWFLREGWKRPAIAMFAYTALIGFEVVYSGEHYVVDVLLALILAGAIFAASQVNWPRLFSGMWQRTLRFRSSESGQAVIEFAFMAPIILVLLLVLFDGGLAVDRRMALQHAIHEGGRAASLGQTKAAVQTRTAAESQDLLQANDTFVNVCYVGTNTAGSPIRVTAHYNYNFVASGDAMLGIFGVGAPTIAMDPKVEYTLEASADASIPICT